MTADENHYFNLMMGLDCLLFHLREVLDDHENCPGCELCQEAEGQAYTIDMYYGAIRSYAPPEACRRFLEETELDEDELALFSSPAVPTPPDTPLVAPAELPPTKEKPYWIA